MEKGIFLFGINKERGITMVIGWRKMKEMQKNSNYMRMGQNNDFQQEQKQCKEKPILMVLFTFLCYRNGFQFTSRVVIIKYLWQHDNQKNILHTSNVWLCLTTGFLVLPATCSLILNLRAHFVWFEYDTLY